MTHLFEGHLLRVAEASLSNLPNMAGTGRVIGRVKVAKRSKLRRFLFFVYVTCGTRRGKSAAW